MRYCLDVESHEDGRGILIQSLPAVFIFKRARKDDDQLVFC
jgi:hypothetical protein